MEMTGLRLLAGVVCLSALLVVWVAGLPGPRRRGAVVLGVLALAWLPLNKPLEGLVLVRMTDDQGFTQADLLAVAAFATALWRWFRDGTTPSRKRVEPSASIGA